MFLSWRQLRYIKYVYYHSEGLAANKFMVVSPGVGRPSGAVSPNTRTRYGPNKYGCALKDWGVEITAPYLNIHC